MKRGLVLFLCFAGGLCLTAGINRWSTGGPYGGHIDFIALDPQTPNVLYAGVQSGGFFKSRNWGQSWEELEGFSSYVTACMVHPLEHKRVIASGSGAIMVSTDGGDTWLAVFTPGSMSCFLADAEEPDTVYASGPGAFYRSANRGDTWAKAATLTGVQIDNISQLPAAPYTLFIGTWANGILKSTNGGLTWSTAMSTAGIGCRVACHPGRPGWVYASVYSPAGIYRSTNGGGSWTPLLESSFNEMVFDPDDRDRLYYISLAGAYLSTDGGATATRIHTPGGRSMALDRSAADGALYLGTLAGIQRSWNDGASFRAASYGMLTYTWSLAVSPEEAGTVYVGDDTGNLFRSRDGGNSWTHLSQHRTLPLNGLTATGATSPPTLFGSVNGDLWKTTNEGSSWAKIISGKYIWDVKTDPANPLRLYASSGWEDWTYDFAGLYTSTDGGSSWNPTLQLDNLNITELLIDPDAPQNLYAGGDGGLYKSTNYGASWNPCMSGLGDTRADGLTFDSSFPRKLYAGTHAGIYRSTNSGASWGLAGLPDKRFAAMGCEETGNVLYAGTRSDGLFRSGNGGSTWPLASPDLQYVDVRCIATDSRGARRAYAATTRGVHAITETANPPIDVQARSTQSGSVNKDLAKQVLPASAVTFLLQENTFPTASSTNPVIVELLLPEGATLGQTLADGELADLALQPAGRTVLPLSVCEYDFNASASAYFPAVDGSAASGVDDNAVQLFHCVEGEDRIWLRLNRSTSTWHPSAAERVLGITIGTSAGVWPPVGNSNWGASGQFRQENTQFFADLRGYDFSAQGEAFPLTPRAFYQKNGLPAGSGFSQSPINLFNLDLDRDDAYADSSLVGAEMTDSATADLDGDGREDLVSVDGGLKRVYWSLGRPDGTFAPPQWRALAGDAPVTVDAADVTGDGRPEILVSDAGGLLTVYNWASLSAKMRAPGEVLAPLQVAALSGTASASLVADVNNDGNKDFLYTDASANTFNILYGQAFGSQNSWASGAGPSALAIGDVDGDADPDVAVANKDGNSVTVYRNGGGSFDSTTYPANGQPVAVALADFGRDGRADLAVALADRKALAAWTAGAGGGFDPGQAQWIYFQNPPSALSADNFDGTHGPDVLLGFADFYKLALCTSDAAGALGYAYAINTLGDLELDPVNHVTLTENAVLSVAGGTAYGGVCSRAGVAALAQQPFNLVHFPRSANLSFSVVNLGAAAALLNLELYNDAGTLQSGVTQSVPPGQQFARYLTDPTLFGSAAASAARWVRGFLTQAATYGFWLANDGSTLNYLDGLPLADIRNARSRFLLPAGADPLRQVLLLNPSQDQAQVTVQRLGGGSVKQTLPFLLAGRARQVLDLATAMPALAAEDYLLVSADRPIIGCQLWGDNQKLAALDGLPVPESPATLYCPHIASGDLGVNYQTWLTLVNPSEEGTAVSLWLYGDSGQLLGSVPVQTVPARSKLHQNFVALFGAAQPLTGYLLVEPAGPGTLAGAVTFGEAGAGRFLSALPLSDSGAADYIIGHIANGTLGEIAFFTGLAVLNPHDAPHSVRVSAFDQTGQPLDTTTDAVPAHGREVFLLDQKLPGLSALFGGYLRIEDLTDPAAQLRVFALFGDTPLNFLSAVAAQPVRE